MFVASGAVRLKGLAVMAGFHPVSRERHGAKSWKKPASYRWAAGVPWCEVGLGELAGIAGSMPIGFLQRGEDYVPVAILSWPPGRNLFVGPSGEWRGLVVPAELSAWPFRLVERGGGGGLAWCVDEGGLSVDREGEALFNVDGTIAPGLKPVLEHLQRFDGEKRRLRAAARMLVDAGVVEPWPIMAGAETQQRELRGIHRVDAGSLGRLDESLYVRLHRERALDLAFAQLLSMGHVRLLQRRSEPQRGRAARAAIAEGDQAFMMPTDDTLHF